MSLPVTSEQRRQVLGHPPDSSICCYHALHISQVNYRTWMLFSVDMDWQLVNCGLFSALYDFFEGIYCRGETSRTGAAKMGRFSLAASFFISQKWSTSVAKWYVPKWCSSLEILRTWRLLWCATVTPASAVCNQEHTEKTRKLSYRKGDRAMRFI